MKKHTNRKSAALASRLLLLTSAIALPATAMASDWNATTSLFGTAGNWTPSGVPSGTVANITNGGTAQITTGDNFSITDLNLGGNSGTGNISQNGGTLTTTHQVILGGDNNFGGTGVGSYTMTGGSLVNNGSQEVWIGSRGGTGNLTMSGASTLSNSNWIIFGRDTGGTGNATLSGTSSITKTGGGNIALAVFTATTSTVTMSESASMTSNNEIRIGWGNNSTLTKGVLNMSGNSTISAGGNIQVALREGGGSAGPTGELHMSGSAIASAGNEFYVGSAAGSNGTLTMDNTSKINVTNGFVVGRFNSTGVATVNGNSEMAIGGFNVIGDGPPAVGTLVVNDNANVHSNFQLWLGLNDSHSTVTINGGLVHASPSLNNGGATDATGAGVSFSRVSTTGGSGTLNLNGGVLETPGFSKYGGTAAINLNGGTIKATGMTTTGSFFDSIANSEINIQAGGAKFDTNGNAITVVQNLSGAGGLTKQGAGSLTLSGASNFAGASTVTAGTLIAANATALGSGGALVTGGTLDLNGASVLALNLSAANFTLNGGTLSLTLGGSFDTITSTGSFALTSGTIDLGGTVANGTYQVLNFTSGSVGSISFAGLSPGQMASISNTGSLTITSVPEPSTTCVALAGLAIFACGARMIKRRRLHS